jgi:hypothetical protein
MTPPWVCRRPSEKPGGGHDPGFEPATDQADDLGI